MVTDTITVEHPDFGVVVFTSPTPRQIDILVRYKELIKENGKNKKQNKRLDYFMDIEVPKDKTRNTSVRRTNSRKINNKTAKPNSK